MTPMLRRLAAALVTLAVALPLAACGQSDQEKAQKTVCSARDDISQQVQSLKGMTASTLSVNQITQSLSSIKSDLGDIAEAQSDLSGQRRQQVQAANKAFSSQIQTILKQLPGALASGDTRTQVADAVQQLVRSYQQTFAKVDCS